MPTVAATRRLSPKVRRLLQEHGLQARSIAGTGAGGRVTPTDVLGAAGVPRRATGRTLLASPVARRLLRDAGIDLPTAAGHGDGRPLVRADAQRMVTARAATSGSTADSGPSSGRSSQVEVDVTLLLVSIAAASRDFLAHHGFDLSAEVALASAAAAVLVNRPELAVASVLPSPEDGRAYPAVHVGFPRAPVRGTGLAVVPDVQYLTVAGLARRARTAVMATDEPASAAAPSPAVVVATETAAPDDRPGGAAIGLLTISSPTPRTVTTMGPLGTEVVDTRPHATVRLHHHDGTSPAAAAAFLEELSRALASWALPVGP